MAPDPVSDRVTSVVAPLRSVLDVLCETVCQGRRKLFDVQQPPCYTARIRENAHARAHIQVFWMPTSSAACLAFFREVGHASRHAKHSWVHHCTGPAFT